MSYSNINNPVNYQLQGFGQNGVRTISTDQLYIQGEYYRVLVAEEDSYVTAVSVLGDDLTAEFVYAGTTIYGLFTEVSVTSGSLTAYIAGPTDIEDVWAYINAYGQTNAARIEAADCAKDAIAPLLDKYYAKASLVMVPSLYKTSIVYSERPLTTDGQLAFTRSNDTATRVGPDGYIEKVRTNFCLYSQGFASWAIQGTPTRTTGVTDPNGGTTAATISNVSTTGNFTSGIRLDANPMTISAGGKITASVYLKGSGTIGIALERSVSGTYFFETTSVTLTSSWVRYTFSPTIVNAASGFQIYVANFTGSTATSFDIAFVQVEQGDIATDYIPTTTAAVSVGPVANLPRLNYPINSDGSVGCPSLLLEPQRTNLALYSEQFNDAAWGGENATITANAVTSPSGYQDADTLTDNNTNGRHRVLQGMSATNGTTYTYSVFVKKNSSGRFLLINAASLTNARAALNLDTLEVTNINGTGKVEDYGNGWYRFSVTGTATATSTQGTYIQMQNSASDVNYVGDGSSFYLWGAQFEAGSYATSYIPTLGASVTRGADACSKTGISSLIGQTEGTLYWEGSINGIPVDQTIFGVEKQSSFFVIRFGGNGTNIYAQSYNGSTSLFFETTTPSVGQTIKLAFAYKAGSYAFYKNGTLVASGTNASTIPACDKLQTNTLWSNSNGIGAYNTSQALLFPTRLTNQELQDLTTL